MKTAEVPEQSQLVVHYKHVGQEFEVYRVLAETGMAPEHVVGLLKAAIDWAEDR